MANSESGCALTSSTRFGLIVDFSSYVACAHRHMFNVCCLIAHTSFYVACARMNV